MDSLADTKLVKADGTEVEASTGLADKEIVLFYFSAHWCPPCRQFTPMLKDFYQELMDMEAKVEVVFVSSDRSQEDMANYMKESHGNWLAVQHNSDTANALKKKYGVSGIPCLVVVKKNGDLVTKDGRSGVTSMPPAQAIKQWTK
jgi:nucleoredoxin